MRVAIGLVIAAAIGAFALWVHLYEFNASYTWDSALQLSIGRLQRLFPDLRLYRDLWDVKPPGIYWYQALVFRLLPPAAASLHIADFAVYLFAAAAFYRLARLESRGPLALLATCVWLWFGHHPAFNNDAGFYSEEYAAILGVLAVAAAAHYRRHGRLWVAGASGALVAAAVLFKHPGAASGLPALILIAARRPARAVPLCLASGALVILLVAACFAWQGAFEAFMDCQVWFLIEQRWARPLDPLAPWYELPSRVAEGFAPYAWLIAAGLFGAAVCVLRPTRFRLAVLVWLIADVALVVLQRFYFAHTWIMIFPSLTLTALVGAAWVLQPRRGERRWGLAARLAAGAVVAALAWGPLAVMVAERQATVRGAWSLLLAGPSAWRQQPGGPLEASIGDYVRAHSAPEDTFFFWGTNTGVAAYWSAERRPASRYLYSFSARGDEQMAELRRAEPAFVMITDTPIAPDRRMVDWLSAHYALVQTLQTDIRIELWRRR